jgi:hypothetical protein
MIRNESHYTIRGNKWKYGLKKDGGNTYTKRKLNVGTDRKAGNYFICGTLSRDRISYCLVEGGRNEPVVFRTAGNKSPWGSRRWNGDID